MTTIAALTALGNVQSQLGNHITAGLNTELSRDEVFEVIMLMAVYTGFLAALNAAQVAKDKFQKKDGDANINVKKTRV